MRVNLQLTINADYRRTHPHTHTVIPASSLLNEKTEKCVCFLNLGVRFLLDYPPSCFITSPFAF